MGPTELSLAFLFFSSAIVLIVIGVFLARFIYKLTILTENLNCIAKSVETEIEPTLSELREAIHSINSIADGANSQLKNTQNAIKSVLGASGAIGNKMKGLLGGLIKGISFGLQLFNKK